MEDQSDWSCNANEAVHISMVQPGDDKLKTLSSFQPEFTYPLFGEDESIFGYKDLSIKLQFAAHDLRSNIHISYDEKFKPVDDIKAVDLIETFKEFLPEESFAREEEFEMAIQNDPTADTFRPPGKLVHIYSRKKRNFEIWAGSLADPKVRELVNRMQIFVSLFIEGGTYIETDDYDWTRERWTVYFVYEKLPKPSAPAGSIYAFIGYATTYRIYVHDSHLIDQQQEEKRKEKVSNGPFPYTQLISMTQLPARLRIAQFLIIPSYQHASHGTQLYRAIHRACVNDPTIHELTVEDPNEAFDALRDNNDYHILEPEFDKHNVTINPDPYNPEQLRRRPHLVPTASLVPTSTLDDLRAKFKIAPTQFSHIVEMYFLSKIPETHRGPNANLTRLMMRKYRAENENDRRYYWWRMLVKQRLYKKHRDMLVQIDQQERIEKLDETLRNVEEGYEALLKAFSARGSKKTKKEKESVKGEEKEKRKESKDKGKEKKNEDDDEESPKSEENGEGKDKETGLAHSSKRKERAKRKYVVIEDSDEDETITAVAAANGSKKKRE